MSLFVPAGPRCPPEGAGTQIRKLDSSLKNRVSDTNMWWSVCGDTDTKRMRGRREPFQRNEDGIVESVLIVRRNAAES